MSDKRALAEEYDAFYRANPNKWADPERDAFAFAAVSSRRKQAPATVLDIGCGNGHTIQYFRERWPETKYTGLDLSTEAIALARARVPEANFIQGWLGDTELGTYDLVILEGVAEHFEELQAGLSAARATLADGGLMYVEVPNCIAYPTSKREEGFRRVNWGSGQHEWHLYRSSWERALSEAGLWILASITGPSVFSEFVWLLVKAERPYEMATIRPPERRTL